MEKHFPFTKSIFILLATILNGVSLWADTASVIILTDPSGATVVIEGESRGTTPGSFSVPAGQGLSIRVELAGYQVVERYLEPIAVGDRRRIDLIEENRLVPLGDNMIIVTQPGAQVFLETRDGLTLADTASAEGRAEISGALLARTFGVEGEVRLLLRRDGFHDKQWILPEGEERIGEIEVSMEARAANIRLRTVPSGASVFLEDQEIGQTPMEWEVMRNLSNLDLVIQLQGYAPVNLPVRALGPGEVRDLGEVRLEELPGRLRLNLRDDRGQSLPGTVLRDVQVFVDGRPFRMIGSEVRGIGEGRLRIVVQHEDYLPASFQVEVGSQPLEQTATLILRPALVRLDVFPDVPFTVRVDGESREVIGGILEIDSGRAQTLEIFAPGQTTISQRLPALPPNREHTVRVEFVGDGAPQPPPSERVAFNLGGISMLWNPPGEDSLQVQGRSNPITIARGFWMSEHEVNQEQFSRIMGRNPSVKHSLEITEEVKEEGEFVNERRFVSGRVVVQRVFREGETRTVTRTEALSAHPVESVSWSDAMEFTRRLSASTRHPIPKGYTLRLPTEAEWMWAARSSRADTGQGPATHRPVSSTPANAQGIRGMTGNVSEWCYDAWSDSLPTGLNPVNRAERAERVVRGSNFRDPAPRSADRRFFASGPSDTIGFRIVLAPEIELLPTLRPSSDDQVRVNPQNAQPPLEIIPAKPRQLYAPSELDAPLKAIRALPPKIPSSLSSEVMGRTVHIAVVVNPEGRVEEAEVRHSDMPSINRYALDAISAWEFAPPLKDGLPVYSAFIQPVTAADYRWSR